MGAAQNMTRPYSDQTRVEMNYSISLQECIKDVLIVC